MTVLACYPLHNGQTGSVDDKNVREYDYVFLVQTDGPTPLVDIANAFGLPPLYSQYPTDAQAYQLSRTPRATNDESAQTWEVTCHYSTKLDQQFNSNPLDRPPRWSGQSNEYTKFAERDINGEAILNISGDKYSDLPDVPDMTVVHHVKFNIATYQEFVDLQATYGNTINDSEWNGYPMHTVRISAVECSEVKIENGVVFYEASMSFQYKRQTWDDALLEIGFNCVTTQLVAGLLPGQQMLRQMKIPLAKDEPALLVPVNAVGDTAFTDNPDDAVFTTWERLYDADFDGLDLSFPVDDQDEYGVS